MMISSKSVFLLSLLVVSSFASGNINAIGESVDEPRFLMEGNHTDGDNFDHHGECHCDEGVVHCLHEEEEAGCECMDGLAYCEEDDHDHGHDDHGKGDNFDHHGECHCDGDVPHCLHEEEEAGCECKDGLAYCEEDDHDHGHDDHGKGDNFDHHGECHCDGDVPHCLHEEEEAGCECKDGLAYCEEDDHGHDDHGKGDNFDHHGECHCDGDVPHCLHEEEEAGCECKDGLAYCEEDDHGHDDHDDDHMCHCDGDVVHCLGEGGLEKEKTCECHDGDAECGDHDDHDDDHMCHCDGDVVHCIGEGGLEKEKTCHCHDGEAECGAEESAQEVSSAFSLRLLGSAVVAAASAMFL